MAKNKINFRGEISEMSANSLIRELDCAPARSSLDMYLYTPGGDVYAGGEMINALDAALSRGVKVNIELGSLVASMGASYVAAARARGCKVTAHRNSEMMFHGCWSVIVGGADELSNQAKAMRDFNATVIDDLKRCGVEDCESWFTADTQKWLNANEIVSLGLADSIVEDDADDDSNARDVATRIAASLNHKEVVNMTEEENKVEAVTEAAPVEVPTVDETKAEESAVEPEAEKTVEAEATKAEAPVAEDIEKQVKDLAETRFRGLQASHDKMISDLKNENAKLHADLEAAIADSTSQREACEKLAKDLAEIRDQLAEKSIELESTENKLRTHVGAVLSNETEEADTQKKSARQILAELPPKERRAFYEAHKAEIDNH